MRQHIIYDIVYTSFDILCDVSPWLIASFVLAGILRQFLDPSTFQRALGNKGFFAVIKATLSGMLLPICSCGVIPLGLGMYYTGAYLGPTLAFMVATPIINPAAVLLAYGLLGPKIASIYLLAGFLVPVLIGVLANLFAGDEIHAPGMETQINQTDFDAQENIPMGKRLLIGLNWGVFELGNMVSKYIVFGVVLAGILIAAVPPHIIQSYLGDPGMVSIFGIAAMGAVVYVCAVGHIPFVAAIVASGAAPGVAITFLMTGAATNLPELISIYKMIGKRAVLIYTSLVVSSSLIIGWLTNQWLGRDFIPHYNLGETKEIVGVANWLILSVPQPVQTASSIVILALFLRAYKPFFTNLIRKKASA